MGRGGESAAATPTTAPGGNSRSPGVDDDAYALMMDLFEAEVLKLQQRGGGAAQVASQGSGAGRAGSVALAGVLGCAR